MIGKNKMKDWKAAVRTWEKNSSESKAIKEEMPNRSRIEAQKTDKYLKSLTSEVGNY